MRGGLVAVERVGEGPGLNEYNGITKGTDSVCSGDLLLNDVVLRWRGGGRGGEGGDGNGFVCTLVVVLRGARGGEERSDRAEGDIRGLLMFDHEGLACCLSVSPPQPPL